MNKKAEQQPIRIDDRLQSVAVIMDGNGRWAKARHLPRTAGHVAGAKTAQNTLEYLRSIGIHTVTLYAFSTENWKRPQKEIDTIMELIYRYLDEVVLKKMEYDHEFAMFFLGDKARLSEKLRKKCLEVEEKAKDRPFVCNIALNYGGRDEIVHAARACVAAGEELTEENISRHTYTAGLRDPDLIIRTGGDYRLSNFLLWQSAYSELYVTPTLWPDFDSKAIDEAVRDFYSRKRRYGGLDAEDSGTKEG